MVPDSFTDGGNNGGSTSSLTFAHTCSGSDRMLVVAFAGDTTSDLITGVTYNGVAMTLAAKRTPGGANNRWTYVYYLLAPATGSNNVVISASGTIYILGLAGSWTSAQQSSQPDATGTNQSAGAANTLTSSLTTLTDNCWVIFAENGYTGSANANAPPTAGSGCVRRTYDGTFGTIGLFDTNGPKTPAGSVSVTTNRSTPDDSNRIMHVLASFKPAVSAAAPKTLALLGVGA